MTKEELFAKKKTDGVGGILYIEDVEEFFKDKVIIQRGDNRHPYADVLHEWIEGADIQRNYCVGTNIDMPSSIKYLSDEYRIKPKEPIYEWQWAIKYNVNDEYEISTYHTEHEIQTSRDFEKAFFEKLEFTKRERKTN